jgi:hypothetical protein
MMRALLVLLMLAGCTLPEVRAYGIPTAPDQPNVCGPASLADPQQELIDELRCNGVWKSSRSAASGARRTCSDPGVVRMNKGQQTLACQGRPS